MYATLLPLEIILTLQGITAAIICWILVFGPNDE